MSSRKSLKRSYLLDERVRHAFLLVMGGEDVVEKSGVVDGFHERLEDGGGVDGGVVEEDGASSSAVMGCRKSCCSCGVSRGSAMSSW
jgi:hypothetical protein